MNDLSQTNSQNHLRYLDSARGIAALMVCVSHYIGCAFPNQPTNKYFFLLFNGNDAVAFFFVLSGFVLSYKYLVLKKELDIRKFWVSRLFRLFPPFFVTLFLLTIYGSWGDLSLKHLADVFALNKTMFWEEALLFRFHNSIYFPGWTLSMELLMSFPLALFIILAMKNKKYSVYLWVAFAIQAFPFYTMFISGIVVCAYLGDIKAPSFKRSWWYRFRYLLISTGVAFFCIRHIAAISPLGSTYLYLTSYLGIDYYSYSGIASFIFLGAILISAKAQKILQIKPLLFIGKVSYGLYLVHPLCIYITDRITRSYFTSLSGFGKIAIPFSCFLVLAFAAAFLMYKFVETPSIAAGQKLIGRMKPSLSAKVEE